MSPRSALLLSSAFVLTAAAPQNAVAPIAPELSVATIGAVTLAPDEGAMAVRLTVPDLAADSRQTSLRVVTGSGQTIELGAAFFPSWSADSTALYFVAEHNGSPAARKLDLASGAIETVGVLTALPSTLSWNAAHNRVAFIAYGPGKASFVPRPAEGPAAIQKPAVITHAYFRGEDGSSVPNVTPQLFVAELGAGSQRRIKLPQDALLDETETGNGGPPVWSADGNSLFVAPARGFDTRFNLPAVNRDLVTINLRSGAAQWLTATPAVEESPLASPDGRTLAFLRQRGDPKGVVYARDVVLRDLRSGAERIVPGLAGIYVQSIAWGDKGGLVAATLERARVVISHIDSVGERTILTDQATSGGYSLSTRGALGFVRSTANLPSEAATIDTAGLLRNWTSVNAAVASLPAQIVSEIHYPSAHADHRPIHAIVSRPACAVDPRSLPVIVDLHGGPYSASTLSYDASRAFFTAQGYVVIQPNYRGSVGYGDAFSQLSDRRAYPGRAGDPTDPSEMGLDVAGVVEAIRRGGIGDPERIFLRGVSAGALLTSWTIGRTDEFRAAVSQSWYSSEWTAPAYGSYQIRRYFNGPPWDPTYANEYRERSPFALADRIKTPLMILQGEADWITPLMEAEKFYYTLRTRGLDVALVRFPDEIHGIRRHPYSLHNALRIETDWFRAHDVAGAGDSSACIRANSQPRIASTNAAAARQ